MMKSVLDALMFSVSAAVAIAVGVVVTLAVLALLGLIISGSMQLLAWFWQTIKARTAERKAAPKEPPYVCGSMLGPDALEYAPTRAELRFKLARSWNENPDLRDTHGEAGQSRAFEDLCRMAGL